MLHKLLSLFIFTVIFTLSVACGGGDAEDNVAEAAPTPTEVLISVKNYQQGQVSAIQTQAVAKSTAISLMNVKITALDCKGKPETVVITNAGDFQQDMTGWTIVNEGAKHTFNFPNEFILDPGLAVEVVSGTLGDNTNSKLYWKKQTVWNNDGDTASVLDSTGRILGTMDCP